MPEIVKCKICDTKDLSRFKENKQSLTGYFYTCEKCKYNEKERIKRLKQIAIDKETQYKDILTKDLIDCSERELNIKQTYLLENIFSTLSSVLYHQVQNND